jgi:hypothetical protein
MEHRGTHSWKNVEIDVREAQSSVPHTPDPLEAFRPTLEVDDRVAVQHLLTGPDVYFGDDP